MYCTLDRIKPLAEGILGDYQGGFRPNRSTIDEIIIIKQIFQKIWKNNKKVYILFVYFKKTYDSIHKPSLFNILKEFSLPKKLINLIKATIENSEIKIKIGSFKSQYFKVTTDLRQGNVLSSILLNLISEKIVRDMNIPGLSQSKIRLLAYADVIAIIGDSIEIIKKYCKKLMDSVSEIGRSHNK